MAGFDQDAIRSLAQRYVQGSLSAEEEAALEAYFLDKPDLLEELELDLMLHIGLSAAAELLADDHRRVSWWLAPVFSPLTLAVLAAGIAAVVFLGTYFWIGTDTGDRSRTRPAHASVAVLTLVQTRSLTPPTAPALRVSGERETVAIRILLDYPEATRYRVTLIRSGADDPVVVDGVEPQGDGELWILVDAQAMLSGSYEAVVESQMDAEFTEVVRLSFDIETTP